MSNPMYNSKSDNLVPQKSTDGTPPPATAVNPRNGWTLGVGTWYVELGASEGPLMSEAWVGSFHVKWNAAFAAVITLEASNFPASPTGNGQGTDVTGWEAATAGNWVPENPTTARVDTLGGASNTISNLTLTAGGAAIGAMLAYIDNAGARRYRLKVVVTTQGELRIGACGKD